MVTLATLQLQYNIALQDKAGIVEQITASTDVRDKSILSAIAEYNRRIPNLQTDLVTTITTGTYPAPSPWAVGSRFVALEYPIDNSPPTYYSPKYFRLYHKETGLFYKVDPNPSGSFRLTYTAPHVLNGMLDGYDTVPSSHEGIVGRLAAAYAALAMAAYYAQTVASNIDSVNYRTKEQEWRGVADALMKKINDELIRDEVDFQKQSEPCYYFKGWA